MATETQTLESNELMAVEKPVSRISWGGIFIGAIATIAVGILLNSLGAAIGLSAIDPARGQWGGNVGVITGIWSFLSIVVATFLGALLAARASTVFFKRDAASLGFMAWALSFIGMIAFVAFMASYTARTTATLTGSTLQAAGTAAQAGAEAANQQQIAQLQQQLQQLQAGQVQPEAAAGVAADVGAAASWWFFLTALFGMLAGIFGGLAGLPKAAREGKGLEVRRGAKLRPREV